MSSLIKLTRTIHFLEQFIIYNAFMYYVCTVLPALRANSCIAIDRLMIELLDFHIPFLSFTNAGFKGYWQELAEQKAENHSTSIDFNTFSPFYFDVIIYTRFVMNHHYSPRAVHTTPE